LKFCWTTSDFEADDWPSYWLKTTSSIWSETHKKRHENAQDFLAEEPVAGAAGPAFGSAKGERTKWFGRAVGQARSTRHQISGYSQG
jgi:hypothetical protein